MCHKPIKSNLLLLFVCFSALFTGCGTQAQPSGSYESYVMDQTRSFQTAEVLCGEATAVQTIKGVRFVVDTQAVYSDVPSGILQELVNPTSGGSRSTYVDKGQTLAIVQTPVSETVLEEQNLLLTRTQEAYEAALAEADAELTALRDELDSYSGTERALQEIKIQQAELAREQLIAETEQRLSEEAAALEALRTAAEPHKILAPCSGFVTEVAELHLGDSLNTGAYLLTLLPSEQDMMTLRVGDSEKQLRYGMEVTISSKEATVTATVVSAADVVPTEKWNSYATLLFTEYPEGINFYTSYDMTFSTIALDNVLTVPASAVQVHDYQTYVELYEDGRITMQYVTVGKTINDRALILQGLTEGQTVVLP